MAIEEIIGHGVVSAIKEIFCEELLLDRVQVQKTSPDFEGDFTVVVFPMLSISKKSPEDTGKEIGEYLEKNLSEITAFNVIKGFLNLTVSDGYWLGEFSRICKEDNFGYALQKSGSTIMVEYSSPNTNKPLHLGHIRNNLLGWSVAEILKANGHKVIKTQIVNDRGIHICKSMLAWQKWGKDETPESSEMKGDKLVGKYYVEFESHFREEVSELIAEGQLQEKAEKNAPLMLEAQEMLLKWEKDDNDVRDLWVKMNDWVYKGFKITYKNLGVDFDKIYYESDTYVLGKTIVKQGLEKGVLTKKEDGSVWCDMKDEDLDEKLLIRADGTSVYMTQDIGTAAQRFKEYTLDEMIYVVGNEQKYHFKVLFIILNKLGYEQAENCHHFSYGMVDLPSGKMKSREGTVVDADDLIAEMIAAAEQTSNEFGKLEEIPNEDRESLYRIIALGALKYFLLKVDPKKQMLFNPEESVDFTGNTGPFIQYTYARIQSVLRKAKLMELQLTKGGTELLEEEREIINLIYEYPKIVKTAGEEYSPALIANYSYELVKTYNKFYQSVPILKAEKEEEKGFRVALSEMTGKIIKSAMNLLGIEVPERM